MENDPLWYKDAIIYEIHVKSFFDSNGDGIGDLQGLIQKLDYLQDLGITAVWLLPFYPSPLRDDGYDISDYMNVHPNYGTLADFKIFLKEAKRRGLKVITELVINHTSDQHAWFQKARRAPPGSAERDFYVWSEKGDQYKDARIIFKDFETSNWTWDPVAKAHYWHRFYSHQPDLNFDNPAVRKEVFRILDFWAKLGVDGMRLDAVPYLFERDGTSCENLPETHAFLKDLRRHLDRRFQGRMLLAEANQWPEDAVPYYGNGDECHMAFHFPIMPRLFMSIHMEDCSPVVDILKQTPSIPANCQWAFFLRNHDELTLEMVTDEERDYMYRVYAHDRDARINLGIRRRLAPLLGNHRRKNELMNGLLFSLPGTPVIYYGDELGMGDNIYLGDRNGVRTPMQWSADRNAGFSKANPQKLYLPVIIDPEYNYETINVETRQGNPHSLLNWMKRVIALRKKHRAFGMGTLEWIPTSNRKVLVFLRKYQNECILVAANLSRFTQYVEMDLAAYQGLHLMEIFGRVEFPPVSDKPYFLSLGPHEFFWFSLERKENPIVVRETTAIPSLTMTHSDFSQWFKNRKADFLSLLPEYFERQRWFSGKGKSIRQIKWMEGFPFKESDGIHVWLIWLEAEYASHESEKFFLPLCFVPESKEEVLKGVPTEKRVCRLEWKDKKQTTPFFVVDAVFLPLFWKSLLACWNGKEKNPVLESEVHLSAPLDKAKFKAISSLPVTLLSAEQSNSSALVGNEYVFKLYRRMEEGVQPELEMVQFLNHSPFRASLASFFGGLHFKKNKKEKYTLGLVSECVQNLGDAWKYTLEEIDRYLERVLSRRNDLSPDSATAPKEVFKQSHEAPNPLAVELLATYLETSRLLGIRTAELHLALSGNNQDTRFSVEGFNPLYQRSLYQSMTSLLEQTFLKLKPFSSQGSEEIRELVKVVLPCKELAAKKFKTLTQMKLSSQRIRCHGDLHLGQILYTGKDFVFIDFEGMPARSFEDRKIKRSPLRDVVSMLRSFDYASHTALQNHTQKGHLRPEDMGFLKPWGKFWSRWVSSAYLRAYLTRVQNASFFPKEEKEWEALLEIYLLEKTLLELNYEIHFRPSWVSIPLSGLREYLLPMEAKPIS